EPQPTDPYEITSQISESMRRLAGDPQGALEILRRLDQRYPGEERVLSRLGYVYQVIGYSDSAAMCYQGALKANPRSLEAGKALALLYFGDGRDREGMLVLEELISANGHAIGAYKTVGNTLRDIGRLDEALQIFERGRAQSARNAVLTLEVAALHLQMGNYQQAVDEYLAYVGDVARNYAFVRGKILEAMSEAGDQQDAVVAGLQGRLETGQGNRFVILDILAAHYLERGALEKSLEMALLADKEPQSDGSVLLLLAEQILAGAESRPREQRAHYLDLGVRALDAFARSRPRAPGSDRAKYMLARIYTELGAGVVPDMPAAERTAYLERAVAEYQDLSRRHPASEYAELAYLERGEILLHRLKRSHDALDAYKSGAVNSRRYGDVFAARIADLYIGLGDYDAADHYLASMARSRSPELMRTADYYTGLLLASRGEFAAARDTLTALAELDPASPYTNDAIEAAWVIEEATQYESQALPVYVEAMRAEMIGDTATVVARLFAIAAMPVHETLRPRALFWLGRTLRQSGDLHGALTTLRRFLEEYPEEQMRPDVKREIAAVYEFGFEQYARALSEYEAVLVEYPEYAFLDEVRKDVRRLRYIVKGERNGH
ncbi:MAG: tetratricopeptide repeat protein, partial [Candidatus Krumholzibacteria bacterium]|nr:tetratricopeptide repeat protein [Candidatus Krumholzibacteria bacterium]